MTERFTFSGSLGRLRPLGRLTRTVLLWSFAAGTAVAQPTAPSPAPVATLTRSWYFEAALVAVMVGLALFVVCRSSRRN